MEELPINIVHLLYRNINDFSEIDFISLFR
jgi:hypothetical protein